MKNSKLKFSEYMKNISRFKSFDKFVLILKALVLLKQAISITILWQWSQGKWPCYDYQNCSHYQLKQFADITEKSRTVP